MKFYSYDYVLSQIGQQNGIMVGFGIVLLAVTVFLLSRHTMIKKGIKFRELVMISALALFSSAFGQHHDLSKQSSF
ncbi:Protein of uncharacterised function (DUF3290) [Streptococcus pneumoniae]|uniref:Protein of uncharacterized function (DUF3290) n=1 Tax=Streptococcus pneumoniae TaxID=1313 RepID=A0AAX2LBW4_STREE|nr:hypothetical protein SPAR95_1789 [Streptococcus pneumoniae SPAR95]KXT24259.1 hypothetical protein AYO32_01100 [Streptococcus pneumoniae]OYL05103.1 DUF3290 domain-containing protein [Streptococcus pneumoniae K2557]KXW27464.1 hypothetical protein NTPn32_02550 [Streptococcus pneumoniae]ODO21626.1 hypothetical protein A4363_03965 [Streptococcus pneumoniae]